MAYRISGLDPTPFRPLYGLGDQALADGRALEPLIETFLAQPDIAYLHAHYARQGCYAAGIDRP